MNFRTSATSATVLSSWNYKIERENIDSTQNFASFTKDQYAIATFARYYYQP